MNVAAGIIELSVDNNYSNILLCVAREEMEMEGEKR